MSTLTEMREAHMKVTKKKDWRMERFSKANLSGHIHTLLDDQRYLFQKAEGKAYDDNNGTAQCSTTEGHAAHAAFIALETLLDDINWWGVR